MNEQLLIDIVKNNAEHIRVINGELAEIASRLAVLETKLELLAKVSYLVLALVLGLVVEKVFRRVFNKGGK